VLKRLDRCDPTDLAIRVAELRKTGEVTLAAEGYPSESAVFALRADCRYVGQSSELTIPVRGESLDAPALAALRDDFIASYRETFGYASDEPVELVNLRLSARGISDTRLDFARVRLAGDAVAGTSARRPVSFERGKPAVDTPVVSRGSMIGRTLEGPVIIESYDTTAVIPPGARVTGDASGNLHIEIDS
jgi:N-methylhydantoinase A